MAWLGHGAAGNDTGLTSTGAYRVPAGPLSLDGPVERPEKGRLPLRGDLAHIALAGRYLVAHYAMPRLFHAGPDGAVLRLAADQAAEAVVTLDPGDVFEALDIAGDWVWGACGPEGPAGYAPRGDIVEAD